MWIEHDVRINRFLSALFFAENEVNPLVYVLLNLSGLESSPELLVELNDVGRPLRVFDI